MMNTSDSLRWLLIILLLCFTVMGCRTKPPVSGSKSGSVVILSRGPYTIFARDGSLTTYKLEFKADDINKVEENKLIAEKLLPAVITDAESLKINRIVIQAIAEQKMGILKVKTNYPYYWIKSNDGKWIFYKKMP